MTKKRLEALVEKLTLAAADDGRVRALWLEGLSYPECRSPKGPLQVHAAVADPDFDEFCAEHESFLKRCGSVRQHEEEEGPCKGILCRAVLLEGAKIDLSVERASLLAKRLRRAVIPLEDKTGQLRSVLTYAPESWFPS